MFHAFKLKAYLFRISISVHFKTSFVFKYIIIFLAVFIKMTVIWYEKAFYIFVLTWTALWYPANKYLFSEWKRTAF